MTHVRLRARCAVAAVGMFALIAPAALSGQRVDRGVVSPVAINPRGFTTSTAFVERETSGHHGSRAHHAAVGAMIGGAVGLVVGIAGDRPGLGRGEMRGGHFHNLWLVTAPLGALVGALIGTVRQAD